MKYILLTFIIFYVTLINAQDISVNYNISVEGKNVGTLNALKSTNGNNVTYTINSRSSVHFFGEITVLTHLIVEFKDGILESAKYTVKKDGKLYDRSSINRNKNQYTLKRKGKKSVFKGEVKHCTAQLYFEEPKRLTKIFGEVEGVYKDISETDPNVFLLVDPRGHHKNTYTYEKGILKKGLIDHAIFDFVISRIE